MFGGSEGTGLATAQLCHEKDAEITLIGRDVGKLQAAAAALAGSEWRSADVRNGAVVAEALASLAHIDHVFISVGLGGASNILRSDMASLRQPFEERIFGTFTIVRAAAPKMKEGSITLMSGMNASRVRPGACPQETAALCAVEIVDAHSRSRSCSHTRQCGGARLMNTPRLEQTLVPKGRFASRALRGSCRGSALDVPTRWRAPFSCS